MKPKFYFLGLIFLLISGIGAAQMRTISGYVFDTDRLPLPGVSVYIEGTQIATMTNSNGNYHLVVPTGHCRITFSYIGMIDKIYDSDSIPKNIFLVEETTTIEMEISIIKTNTNVT